MIYLPKFIPFLRKKQVKKVYKYDFVDIGDFDENVDEEQMGIRITEGPYKDLMYFYQRVQFVEDKENDRCTVKFEWVPVANAPEHDTQDLYDILGDILTDVIETHPAKFDTIDRESQSPDIDGI